MSKLSEADLSDDYSSFLKREEKKLSAQLHHTLTPLFTINYPYHYNNASYFCVSPHQSDMKRPECFYWLNLSLQCFAFSPPARCVVRTADHLLAPDIHTSRKKK